jgi:hypothetical protein
MGYWNGGKVQSGGLRVVRSNAGFGALAHPSPSTWPAWQKALSSYLALSPPVVPHATVIARYRHNPQLQIIIRSLSDTKRAERV